MTVAVITDSTAYIPSDRAERLCIRTAPLHVSVGGAVTVDEDGFGPAELVSAFDRRKRVTTSGATSAELAEIYREALDEGATGVVSVHLSRRLSATFDAARLAAQEVDPDRIRVVDSRSTAMGLGFAVLAAARTAGPEADREMVAGVAERVAAQTTTLFSVQTLEHLRRGGRIGPATALLGGALAIKPLLHVREGAIEPLEKVRTSRRATERLVELAVAAATGPCVIAVHHLGAAERAQRLAQAIRERVPDCAECLVTEVGAVIGAHIGPGAVGVVIAPRSAW